MADLILCCSVLNRMRFAYSVHRGGLIFVCLLWIFAFTGQAADHYVVPTNPAAANPYTSWTTAGTSIIDVVNVAMTNTAPRVVWVTNGEYCLTNQIAMTNLITVRSFSGNYSNTLVYAGWPTYTNRCFYVVNSGVVDGFTISNGHYWASNDYTGGGGAYVYTGTVQNCKFVYNICSNDGLSVGGGALYMFNALVSNCMFYTNMAYGVGSYNRAHGGGVYNLGGNSLIVNCSFISNNSTHAWSGGGIASEASCTVSNCFFAFNADGTHGAGAYFYGTLITDCIFSNNVYEGPYGSGGVAIFGGVLRNSVIVNNRSSGANYGGGVAIWGGGIVSNCVITGNSRAGVYMPQDATISGCQISNNINLGSYYYGAGIYTIRGVVKNCYIHHNTNWGSRGGGGIYMTNAAINRPTSGVFNCTIVNNWSTNEGGGIAADGPSNYIVNCVIANNTSYSGNYPNVYYGSYSGENSSNFYNSCVVTANAGILAANQGNITNDPMFKDPDTGNYRLKVNSPCVNTGTNLSWTTNNAVDLDGRIRIRYGRVDMGAYETINEATFYKFH